MPKKAKSKKAKPKQVDLIIEIVVEAIKSSAAGEKVTIRETFELVRKIRPALKKAGFS
jgi:hypothetical protein